MDDTNSLIEQRKAKLAALRAKGIDPFKNKFTPGETCQHAREHYAEGREVALAGRITAHRDMGKSMFMDIRDQSGRMQIYAQKNVLGDEPFAIFQHLDLADFIGVRGKLFTTKTNEISVKITSFVILAKALRPPPAKWHGLEDTEIRYRQRYLDLMASKAAAPGTSTTGFEKGSPGDVLLLRSEIIREIRNFLHARGFVEVETPMMQAIPGGAAAQPFITKHNALGCNFYLRIALELPLKRMLVGGVDKVFEIGRVFRNEGLSRKHNPEFTMLEAYEAYGDYESMMELVQGLVCHVAQKVLGTLKVPTAEQFSASDFLLSNSWRLCEELGSFQTIKNLSGIPVFSELVQRINQLPKSLDTSNCHKIISELLVILKDIREAVQNGMNQWHSANQSSLLQQAAGFLLELKAIEEPCQDLPDKMIDLTPNWRRVKYKDLIRQMIQKDWFEISRSKRLERAIEIGIDFKGAAIADLKKRASLILQKDSISQIEWDRLVDEQQKAIDSFLALSDGTPPEDFEVTGAVFEKLIEPTLIQPTFVTHLPKELVPLAKLSPDDPTTVEVFECCINGQEIAPAYTEQNDPIEQRERLEHQAGGETQKLDEDFLVALEHGMPPAGGMGMGIDRLCMMLLGQESIRDVILFPQLKPK